MTGQLESVAGEVVSSDPLIGAPDDYLTPLDRPSLEEARAWCHRLATTHYENFHVATFLLPKRVRPHFESVYAFCRVSDDLGDEVADTSTALRLLEAWGGMLDECYDAPARSRHPVFVALHPTIVACNLPRSLFHDLLRAFCQDQIKTSYETWDEAVEYSRYSANPVGRLVLMVCGYRDEERALLSDKICTGLQLANFWQDAVRDSEIPRRYIPAEYMARFGVAEGQIEGRVFTPEFGAMMSALVERTRDMLHQGAPISQMVDQELSVTLDLFRKGGEAILDGIAAQGYDVLRGRPVVTRRRKLLLLLGALAGKMRIRRTSGAHAGWEVQATPDLLASRIQTRLPLTCSAAVSHVARHRTFTGLSGFFRAGRAMRCALCTPSCDALTTSLTTRRRPSRLAAPRWLHGSGRGGVPVAERLRRTLCSLP
jgi:squalene synthase HpnC